MFGIRPSPSSEAVGIRPTATIALANQRFKRDGAGLGITLVPSSLQRMNMEGVTYRSIKGSNRPMVTLKLVSRRDEKSAVVKQFISFVRKEAKDYV